MAQALAVPLSSMRGVASRGAVQASEGVDRAMVRAASRCGGALLDALVANRASLILFARSFVGCMSRAEDVVHDVFVKLTAFRNQDEIRQPLAYVMRMVRNASIDACRRQSLESDWHACEEEGVDVASSEPSPEAALLTRDTLRTAFDALSQLPERTRCAFERVRLREETLQETARALGVSQTLVHFMVREAARHCAHCVYGEGGEPQEVRLAASTKKKRAPNVNELGVTPRACS